MERIIFEKNVTTPVCLTNILDNYALVVLGTVEDTNTSDDVR